MKSFVGLPHRYEIFKKKILLLLMILKLLLCRQQNLSESSKNIYWIVGGLPKLKDKIDLKYLKTILSNHIL